jgi:hypothetical protein
MGAKAMAKHRQEALYRQQRRIDTPSTCGAHPTNKKAIVKAAGYSLSRSSSPPQRLVGCRQRKGVRLVKAQRDQNRVLADRNQS